MSFSFGLTELLLLLIAIMLFVAMVSDSITF